MAISNSRKDELIDKLEEILLEDSGLDIDIAVDILEVEENATKEELDFIRNYLHEQGYPL